MEHIIPLGEYPPGTRIEITNGTPRAVEYDIGFGTAGAVSFTLIPGAEFTLTLGDRAPQIKSNDASPAGIRLIGSADET